MIKRIIAVLASALVFAGAFTAPASAATSFKHNVPGSTTSSTARSLLTTNYFYASGSENFTSPNLPTYYSANLQIDNPTITECNGNHTLLELAVQGGPSNHNIMEIGWLKGCGDTAPKLFMFTWKDVSGVQTPEGYNNVNWVDYNGGGLNMGDSLSAYVGTSLKFGWQYDNPTGVAGAGKWWAFQDAAAGGSLKWLGWVLESHWGTFSGATKLQSFGEVTSDVTNPCTDMGNGLTPQVTPTQIGGKIGSVTQLKGTTAMPTNQTLFATNSTYYNILNASTQTKRYGGPGAC